jgi:ABC-type polysaccharide/polyol phosphate transport system ATPase subunit
MSVVISIEHLAKAYRLGQINTGTFSYDLQLWWARLRGKPNPFWRIGDADEEHRNGETLWALKDVSFTVQQGEVLGIIGRNGAGKSTLLKILSRVTAPTSGRVRVKGRIASLLEVGTGFHPELTGRENIYLNGAILGMKRDEITRKFDEIVGFAEIEKFIDTPVKRYSSGMYVRLAFAVAAHLEPEILVVDEVLAVGDAAFQKKCLGKMGDVAKEGRTVLFVSHNMAALSAICDRCLLIEKGEKKLDGSVKTVIDDYLAENVEGGLVFHVKSDLLGWRGICDTTELANVGIDTDLQVRMNFQSGNVPLHRLYLDCAISNERNETVIHLKSKFVRDGINVAANQEVVAKLLIEEPRLAPGKYQMTVYCYSDEGILLWIDNIPLCTVSAISDFGIVKYYDNVKSAILPKFSVDFC